MTKTHPREGRNWPAYILGGRMRTSTLALIIAFVGVGWLYEIYEPGPQAPEQIPASEVVPPGFIPDPDYTWAPRTDVRGPNAATTTSTTPTTTSTTPTTPTTPTSPTGSSAAPTPGEPTPPSLPVPSTEALPPPGPAPSSPASGASVPSDRPAAQSPTAPLPAGGASPASVLPTR